MGDNDAGGAIDFFISYAGADRPWAEWIAWQLEEAGYRVLVQAWDIVAGVNFIERMDRGMQQADRTIAVLSPAYLTSVYGKLELHAAYRADPEGLRRKLLPVRVTPCTPEGLLAVIVHIDLVGIEDEEDGRNRLLAGVRSGVSGRAKPETKPAFPADARAIATRPRFPASERDRSSLAVLHLSEPRFGADAAPGIAEDVARLVDGGAPPPDLVVVTGDLAEAGRPSELALARRFVTGLADAFGLGPDRIVVVPGDHDVSRSACEAYFKTCDADEVEPRRPYWPKWRHYVRMLEELYRLGGVTFDAEQPWTLFEVPELCVVVAGLDSTMADSHREADHHGWLGEAQAQWFADRLARAEEAGWLRVGAVHHSPAGAAEPEHELRDADVLDRVLGGRVHLLLHGHGGGAGRLASGLPLIGAGRGHYHLLRFTGEGLTRWTRRLDGGAWAADAEAQPLARRWPGAQAALGLPAGLAPLAPEPSRPPEDDPRWRDRADDPAALLLSRIAEICELKHVGAKLRRIDGALPHLLVTYFEEGFVRQLRVGAHAGDLTRPDVEAFVARVHATDPEPGSLLVYQGARPDVELEDEALSAGVRLLSFAEYRGLLDLRGYKARQTRRLAGDGLYPPELYVPQRFRALDLPNAPVSEDLPGTLLRLLGSDQGRFVLLLGDFGRGKTFLLRELARLIPEKLPHLTPVLIELRGLEKARSVDELIAQHLAAHGEERIDLAAFRYMLRTGQIALLFDGFDELALRITYERAAVHLETLLEAAEGQAKIVATSRTQHFLSHAQALTALGERVGLLPNRRLLEIEDFSEHQIRSFLVNFYADEARADARLATLRDVRDLLGLSRNARMLWFIADLGDEQLRAARSGSGEIGAAGLYRQILDHWLTHEVNRLEVAGSPSTLDKEQRWDAVTALALRLWETTEQAVELADLNDVARIALADLADLQMSEEQAAHVVGSGTLLTRTGDGRFAFVHASVGEWLVAAEAARRLDAGDPNPVPLRWRQMSELMVEFLCDLADPARCRAWADRVLADPAAGDAAKQNALRIAERVRPSAGIRADLRGRDLRGADFSGQLLREANLSDADLTDARLVGTDLTGATLRGTRLVDARLDRAVLTGADLGGADLTRAVLLGADLRGARVAGGRWHRTALLGADLDPWLIEELRGTAVLPGQPVELALGPATVGVTHSFVHGALPELVAFSPDGEQVAVGVEDGGVVVCDVRTGVPLRTLAGHTGRVWSVAFSPDGGRLITSSDDKTACLWDPATGEQLRTLDPTPGADWPARFAPNGEIVATGSDDGNVRIWDAATGELRLTLLGHTGWIWSLAFSPDSRLLATAGDDGTVRLWDMTSPKPLQVSLGHAGAVWAAAFSPDASLLATAGNDGAVRLWEPGGSLRDELRGHHGAVWSAAFSPDGALLATAGSDHTARLWELGSGRSRTLSGHADQVWSAVFSPDGGLLATAGNDHTVRLWDPVGGELRQTLAGHSGPIWSLAFAPDGGPLATTSSDDTLRLWDPAGGRQLHAVSGHGSRVWSIAFSPEGELLATSASDDTVRFWEPRTGRQRRTLTGQRGQLRTLAFSPSGALLATTGSDGSVRVWDARAGRMHHIVSGRTDYIWTVAFSADGDMIATANDDDTVRLWNTATGREERTLEGHKGRVRSVAFSRDGLLVATGCDDRTVRLWDLATGAEAATLRGHTDRVYSVAFSPDARLLATGSSDTTVRLWEVPSGAEVARLDGHTDRVWSVAFSPDGSLLVSASGDHTARLWDPVQGRGRHVLTGHTDQVWVAAFSPDGELVATAGNDGAVRLWAVDDAERAPALRLTLLGLPDGWAALAPDGRYKVEGSPAGRFWHVAGWCRFEPGELDAYVPAIRRLAEDEAF